MLIECVASSVEMIPMRIKKMSFSCYVCGIIEFDDHITAYFEYLYQ